MTTSQPTEPPKTNDTALEPAAQPTEVIPPDGTDLLVTEKVGNDRLVSVIKVFLAEGAKGFAGGEGDVDISVADLDFAIAMPRSITHALAMLMMRSKLYVVVQRLIITGYTAAKLRKLEAKSPERTVILDMDGKQLGLKARAMQRAVQVVEAIRSNLITVESAEKACTWSELRKLAVEDDEENAETSESSDDKAKALAAKAVKEVESRWNTLVDANGDVTVSDQYTPRAMVLRDLQATPECEATIRTEVVGLPRAAASAKATPDERIAMAQSLLDDITKDLKAFIVKQKEDKKKAEKAAKEKAKAAKAAEAPMDDKALDDAVDQMLNEGKPAKTNRGKAAQAAPASA